MNIFLTKTSQVESNVEKKLANNIIKSQDSEITFVQNSKFKVLLSLHNRQQYQMNKTSARQLELQNIIKSLQSKVHALKRQNSLCKADLEQKIEEAIGREKIIIEQKQKTINFLKEQVNKIRKQTEKQIKLTTAHYQEEEKNSTTNLLKYKSQCEQLQLSLNKTIEQYQKKFKQKQAQISKLSYRVQNLQREKRQFLEQRQNFNKFYLSAIHKLPEREQTLLWVDKLIEFMSKTQTILTNQQKQKESNVNVTIKSIKDELNQISNQIKKNDAYVLTEKQRFIEQFQKLISEAKEDYDEAIKSNEQFWDTFSKIKAKDDSDQLAKLQAQLINCKQNHKKQLQSLHQELRSSQKDKKTLLINFQQFKNLYEIRDKSNKQEIDLLKQSISQLLQSQQLREKQFQSQIQRLGEKMEAVSNKFYQKLDLPIQQMGAKIKSQIQTFKSQFQGFYGDSLLQKQLQKFETHIVEYLVALNNSKQERSYMKQIVEGSLRILDMIKEVEMPSLKQSQISSQKQKMAYSTVSYSYQSNQKDMKDKENKLNYELSTAKKQLQKMKQYCKQLQSKTKGKQMLQSASKYIELAAQNQLLKQRLQVYEKEASGITEAKITQAKLGRINSSLLQKLVQNSELIIKYTEKQDSFIDKMSKCISSLNTFIINPVQMFERLIYQIDRIKIHPSNGLPTVRQVSNQNNCAIFEAKKQAFSLILMKKNEYQTHLYKASSELSKNLRELLSKCPVSKTHRGSSQQQKIDLEKMKPLQSRLLLQKRIKEVQTQKIKNRQEMLARLRILDEKFKNIQQKYNKKQTISFNKVEQNITKKIHDMFVSYNSKQKLKDLGKITYQAFNDLQSKLKQCLIQNQGLVKENQLLRSLKQ